MLNLDKLLTKLVTNTSELKSSLYINSASVSLSASINYFLRVSKKLMDYLTHVNTFADTLTDIYSGTVSTATIETPEGTQTMYFWGEYENGTSLTLKGYYLMYFGPIPAPSTIDESKVISYCHMDIPLPTALSYYLPDTGQDGAIFTSISNTRALGCHGSLNGTSTLRVYVFLTSTTVMTTATELNLFAYFPVMGNTQQKRK